MVKKGSDARRILDPETKKKQTKLELLSTTALLHASFDIRSFSSESAKENDFGLHYVYTYFKVLNLYGHYMERYSTIVHG